MAEKPKGDRFSMERLEDRITPSVCVATAVWRRRQRQGRQGQRQERQGQGRSKKGKGGSKKSKGGSKKGKGDSKKGKGNAKCAPKGKKW